MTDDTRGIVPPTAGSSAVSPGSGPRAAEPSTAAADQGRGYPTQDGGARIDRTESYAAAGSPGLGHRTDQDHGHGAGATQADDRDVVRQDTTPNRVTTPDSVTTQTYDTTHHHGTPQEPDTVRAQEYAPAQDRDGDGRDDRTGAVLPGSAKEMAAAQRARYGGLKMGSAFFGWMCSVGISVILLALLSAAGLVFGLNATVTDAQSAADQASTGIGIGAAIALLVVLFLAYLAGGYVAGRMARFNGIKQGLGVWLWGLIITVLVAVAGLVLGSQYNVFDQLNLPALPVESGTATTAGLIALGAVLVVTLLGALLGGRLGSRYHRRVDRAAFEPLDA